LIVVSDSSPLIALAAVGYLELLQALYGRVMIPKAVRTEVSGVDREVVGDAYATWERVGEELAGV
jgi:predicted nucleic acid-binding protein